MPHDPAVPPEEPASEEPAPEEPARARVPRIDRATLATKLAGPTPPALFEVLPRGYWLKHHLPGARNAPPDVAEATIMAAVPDRHAEIVLYCWDPG